MSTLAVAYAIVWLAVTLYITWLSACQRKLDRRFRAIEAELDDAQAQDESSSRAA